MSSCIFRSSFPLGAGAGAGDAFETVIGCFEVVSGPADVLGGLALVVSGPADVLGGLALVVSGPADVLGGFALVVSGPADVLGGFALVVSGSLLAAGVFGCFAIVRRSSAASDVTGGISADCSLSVSSCRRLTSFFAAVAGLHCVTASTISRSLTIAV